MGVGENIRRLNGKMVCTATRLDLAVLINCVRGSCVELKVQFMQCVVCLKNINLTVEGGPPS